MPEIEVRVDLRGRDVGVAQQFLHAAQVAGGFEHVAREAVAQQVRMHALEQPLPLRERAQPQLHRTWRDGAVATGEHERIVDRPLFGLPLGQRGAREGTDRHAALLAVADKETSLLISGTGDVIEPEDGIIAIGSGGPYALSAARALVGHTALDARTIVTEALNIAGDVCIYTNRNIVVEEL